jgi:hypothetical protein
VHVLLLSFQFFKEKNEVKETEWTFIENIFFTLRRRDAVKKTFSSILDLIFSQSIPSISFSPIALISIISFPINDFRFQSLNFNQFTSTDYLQ